MNSQRTEKPETKPKIATLWAAPRCTSSAFLKAMSQHPQTAALSEPFLDVYYFSQWRLSHRCGDRQGKQNYGATQAIDAIEELIAPLTFVKELAYQALPYIDRAFLGKTINTFIVRDPREVMHSWYRIKEDPTEEEFGFKALERTFEIVTEELHQEPIVVEANAFRREPVRVLSRYCQCLGVSFDPQMTTWDDGKLRHRSWQTDEWESRGKWNKTLESSTGILPPTKVDVEIRFQDRAMVERAQVVYERLSHYAL